MIDDDWDKQIQEDVVCGKLDHLFEQAFKDCDDGIPYCNLNNCNNTELVIEYKYFILMLD